MIDPMDWLTILASLLSAAAVAGVVVGVTRASLQSLRRELEMLRQRHDADIRELRERLDRRFNGSHAN